MPEIRQKATGRKQKGPTKRFRFTVPGRDLDVLEWMDSQENLSMSLRMVIQDYVNKFGPTDAMLNGVGRVRALYGSKPKGGIKGMVKTEPYVPVEQRLEAAPAPLQEAAPAPVQETMPEAPAVAAAPVMQDAGAAEDPMAGITLPDYSAAAAQPGNAAGLIDSII